MATLCMAATTGLAEVGFLQRLVGAELLDVGAARERTTGTGDHDGRDRCIGIGTAKAVHDALAGRQTESVDGRVGHGDHGNGAVDFVFSGHGAVVPWKVKKNDRAFLL